MRIVDGGPTSFHLPGLDQRVTQVLKNIRDDSKDQVIMFTAPMFSHEVAQFFLNMIDDFLSMAIIGRGQLALYLERKSRPPTKSDIAIKFAKKHGLKLIKLRFSEALVEDFTGMPRRF
jgi:hypothetical protein